MRRKDGKPKRLPGFDFNGISTYRQQYQRHYGVGPYPCGSISHGCGELVYLHEADIDHVDGNHENNAKENMQAMHHACHARKSRLTDPPERRAADVERLKRVNADPSIRSARSERAKRQWAEGRLGRQAKGLGKA